MYIFTVTSSFPKLNKGEDFGSVYQNMFLSLRAARKCVDQIAKEDGDGILEKRRDIPKHVFKTLCGKDTFHNFPLCKWIQRELNPKTAETIGSKERYYVITVYKLRDPQVNFTVIR